MSDEEQEQLAEPRELTPTIVLTQGEEGKWDFQSNLPMPAVKWIICDLAKGIRKELD